MTHRLESTCSSTSSDAAHIPPLTLRTPPHWTAILFFAMLAALHWFNAIPAFYHHRWEGFLSLSFATIFTGVSLILWLVACELSIRPGERRIRLRSGYGQLCFERSIPFRNVHGVRVTQASGHSAPACRVEVLCDNEDLDCPLTQLPHQQALCMAMMMNVRLIKVFPDGASEGKARH